MKLQVIKTAQDQLSAISNFIPRNQKQVISSLLKSEEYQFFASKIEQLKGLIDEMPKTYETDGKGDEAIAYLHYFCGSYDFYITEKDIEKEQHQAFGLACCGYPEMGYISIIELVNSPAVELDLFWKPKALNQIQH